MSNYDPDVPKDIVLLKVGDLVTPRGHQLHRLIGYDLASRSIGLILGVTVADDHPRYDVAWLNALERGHPPLKTRGDILEVVK